MAIPTGAVQIAVGLEFDTVYLDKSLPSWAISGTGGIGLELSGVGHSGSLTAVFFTPTFFSFAGVQAASMAQAPDSISLSLTYKVDSVQSWLRGWYVLPPIQPPTTLLNYTFNKFQIHELNFNGLNVHEFTFNREMIFKT
jgi:hypothetical protein